MEKKVIGRRDFMKSTLAGFGGFYFLTLNETKQEEKPFDIKGKEKKRVYRTLGRTGLKLPVINMGVMNSDNPQSHPNRVGFLHPASGHRPRLHAGSERGGNRKRDQGTPQGFLLHRQQGKPAPGSRGLPWTSPELCGDCSRCPVRCPSGFDVKAKIGDIVRLREIPTEYIV